MRPLEQADAKEFASVRFVLTDMDETLTFHGRLRAATYSALERLRDAGLTVIPVTAAPAGWCDQMARMWPVDGVIGENGGFFFRRKPNGHGLDRFFWNSDDGRENSAHLDGIVRSVLNAVPEARLAEDNRFRLTSVAFARPTDAELCAAILSALRAVGADTTVNNLWVLGWFGGYDKLAMTKRVLTQEYGLDVEADKGAVLYTGDSTNDAPMFSYFRHTAGVSTVRDYLSEIPTPPAWITRGPGGAGFVEAADAVLRSRNSVESS